MCHWTHTFVLQRLLYDWPFCLLRCLSFCFCFFFCFRLSVKGATSSEHCRLADPQDTNLVRSVVPMTARGIHRGQLLIEIRYLCPAPGPRWHAPIPPPQLQKKSEEVAAGAVADHLFDGGKCVDQVRR